MVDGEVAGPTANFLRFIDASPVAGWIDHATAGAQATGDGRLGVNLRFPLGDRAGNKVSGEYQFIGNELRLAGVPPLTQVNGRLAFTEAGVRAQDLAVDVLGGAARFSIASAEGETRVTGGGTSTLAALRREFDPPYGAALSGTLDWTIAVAIGRAGLAWTAESNLKRERHRPAGASRQAGGRRGPAQDRAPRQRGAARRGHVDDHLRQRGSRCCCSASSSPGSPASIARWCCWAARRRPAPPSGRSGPVGGCAASWRRSTSTTGWRCSGRGSRAGGGGGAGGVSRALRHRPRRRRPRGVLAPVQRHEASPRAAPGTTGNSTCAAASSPARPRGRRRPPPNRTAGSPRGSPGWCRRMRASSPPWTGAGPRDARPDPARPIRGPRSTWSPKATSSAGATIGRLEFVAQPAGTEWRIDRMTLTNDGGRATAQGQWQSAGSDQQTKLDVELELTETGQLLRALGHPDAVQKRSDPREGPARVGRRAERLRLPDPLRRLPDRGRGRAASPGSSRESASSSACCRCSRCRAGSRSTSPTSSPRASRSTRSPATSRRRRRAEERRTCGSPAPRRRSTCPEPRTSPPRPST